MFVRKVALIILIVGMALENIHSDYVFKSMIADTKIVPHAINYAGHICECRTRKNGFSLDADYVAGISSIKFNNSGSIQSILKNTLIPKLFRVPPIISI